MSSEIFNLLEIQKQQGKFSLTVDQLAISVGETLGLLGPTGAGKTTLLRLLAGLTEPDQGDLFFEGSTRSSMASERFRLRVTLVHQRPLLLTATVRFNVEFGLRLRGIRNRDKQVDSVLQQLGLTQIAMQSATTLSGGQTQLVALARALVIEPDVLLLDEPTSDLDPAHVVLVEETIRQARLNRQMTVVWATHNLFQARRIADQATLLLNGELVETAPTEEFYTSPSDPRTLDFLQGKMVY